MQTGAFYRCVGLMKLKTVSRGVLGGLFVAAGANHFLHKSFYLEIMPPYIPAPSLMVEISGAAEVGLGAWMLTGRGTRAAAWGLIALLVAVFPANVYMALHPEQFARFRPAVLWARLPFQAVFIAWAWWHTRRD